MNTANGWSSTTVQDFTERGQAELKTGPFGTQLHASDYVAEGTPVINVRNIGFGGVRDAELEFLSEETVTRLAGHLLKPGDIVFGRKGAVERHALVRLAQNGWFQGSDCLRLRFNSPEVVPEFVSYSFMTHEHKQWMLNQCSHGATMASLNQEIVNRIPLRLPPATTQRRIASILAAYDDLIANNRRRIAILDEMARSLYHEWFVNFRFPGHQTVELVDTSAGPAPYGWSVRNLSELVTTQYGYTESASAEAVGPKFLRGMDINKSTYIEWDAVPFCPISDQGRDRYRLSKGDIVVIRMADPGKVGIVEQDVDAVFASYLIRLAITSPLVRPYYLFYFLVSERYQGYVTGASTGTTRKSASAGVMTAINLPLPPEPLLTRFEGTVADLRLSLNALLAKNSLLRRTRDLLLPRIISGELDVSGLDIDTGELSA